MPSSNASCGNDSVLPESDITLWQTAKADFAAATGVKALLIVALIVWMAFQWGPGNDIIAAPLAANTFDLVDDGETWPTGILAVAAAGFITGTFWALTQALDAVVVLAGLRLVPGITSRLGRYLRDKGWVSAYADMRWSTRWIISYATGPSVLCVVDVFATGEPGIRNRRSIIVVSVLLAAATVGLVVGVLATAAMVASRVPALVDETEVFIRFAKNPLTWIVIFAGVFAIDRIRRPATNDTAGDDTAGDSASVDHLP